MSWYRCPDSQLGFYLVPAQLPLPLFSPFGVLHPCQVHQRVCLQSAGLLLGLGWWGLCYVTWFSPMYHALPQVLRFAQPSQLLATLGFFPVTGCLSFSFPGGVGWALALPFPFSGLLLLRLLAGVVGVLHRVRVLQLRWCLLVLQVRSPCCPSLTLGWVCFWPAVSQAFVGYVGGLDCPSWFVTALGSWTRTLAVGWSWYLLFSGPFLGFFPLASRLAAGLRWLGFIFSCPPSVALL